MAYTYYNPLKVWLDPASIADVVSYMQKYLSENPIKDTEEINQIIADYIAAHPEIIGGVQSVNGETGAVVLTASDINTTGTTTIQAVLTSLSSQISDIAQTVTGLDSRVTANATGITNEATARANADTALDNRITSLQGAVGSPLLAATAAAMTDTRKIYVYTGSETGYTNGNWYYYNGASWTSGGVYNAVAINTDTTLTVAGMAADAKATGDGLNDLKSNIDYNGVRYYPQNNLLVKPYLNLTGLRAGVESITSDGCNIMHLVNSGSTTYFLLDINKELSAESTFYFKALAKTSAPNLICRLSSVSDATTTIRNFQVGTDWTEVYFSDVMPTNASRFRIGLQIAGELWIKNIVISESPIAYDFSVKETVSEISKTTSLLNGGLDVGNFSEILRSVFSPKYQKLNPNVVVGEYISTSGQPVENDTSRYVAIDVVAGDSYKLTCAHGSAMKMYVLVNSQGNVIDYYPSTTQSTTTEEKEVTITTDGIMYVNSYTNAPQVSKVVGYLTNPATAGLKMIVYGDSWSDANSVASNKKWCDYVSEELGLDLTNNAVSGSGYKDSANYFGKRINDTLTANFTGIIVLFGSGNDLQYISGSKGTASDVWDESLGNSGNTVGACINYAFANIKSIAPLAKVVVISPAPWQVTPPFVAGNNMEQFVELLEQCTENAGFVFVDMYNNSGLRPWDDTQAGLWYEQAPENRVHPNSAGQYFLYPQMRSAIEHVMPRLTQS